MGKKGMYDMNLDFYVFGTKDGVSITLSGNNRGVDIWGRVKSGYNGVTAFHVASNLHKMTIHIR